MTKELFALLTAGTLLIPLVTPALGDDATTGFGSGRRLNAPPVATDQTLPLSTLPHLEGVPWLNSGSPAKGLKVDTLFGPQLDTLGPFLLQPAIPGAQVSLRAGPSGTPHQTP
jgi:hypothetical protein